MKSREFIARFARLSRVYRFAPSVLSKMFCLDPLGQWIDGSIVARNKGMRRDTEETAEVAMFRLVPVKNYFLKSGSRPQLFGGIPS